MANNFCGPSNPLQTIQKQASADRTLQQDRLISQNAASNFRSVHGPNAGRLNPEFEAFQAGYGSPLVQPQLLHEPQLHHTQNPYTHAPQSQPHYRQPNLNRASPGFPIDPSHDSLMQPQTPQWALDFARLHVTPQQAVPVVRDSQFQHQQPSGWNHDFQPQQSLLQSQQFSPMAQQRSYYQPGFEAMSQYASNAQQSSFSDAVGHVQEDSGKGKQKVEDSSVVAAWDEAFENILERERSRASLEAGQNVLMDDNSTAEYLRERIELLEAEAKLLAAEEMTRQHEHELEVQQAAKHVKDQESPRGDDLSQVAGELLERVSDNMSKKFQESKFLALMRQLRDGEAHVEGDKIVGVDDDSGSRAIPPNEQDEDRGRDVISGGDVKMVGALQSRREHEQRRES